MSGGDTLYLYEPNTSADLNDLRWDDDGSGARYQTATNSAGETNNFPTHERPLQEFHSVITALTAVDDDSDGTTDYWDVTLADETPYAFSSAASVLRASDLVTGVEISNMTFTYDSQTLLAVDDYYSDPATGWASVPTLDLNGTLNATVENVTITLPESHGLRVNRSYGATLTDVTVEGAQSRTGNNGYHFVLSEAFNTTATGLQSLDYLTYGGARHSLLFSAYHAEHYNHIHFGEVTRDINFHGSVDSDNFIVIENFDYSSMPLLGHSEFSRHSNGDRPDL